MYAETQKWSHISQLFQLYLTSRQEDRHTRTHTAQPVSNFQRKLQTFDMPPTPPPALPTLTRLGQPGAQDLSVQQPVEVEGTDEAAAAAARGRKVLKT